MDNLPDTQSPSTPTVQIPQNSFIKTTKGKILIFALGVILLTIASYSLNYFNLLPFSKKPTAIINKPPVATPKLTLSCPVEKQYCIEAKTLTYKNNPALGFNLSKNTVVKSISNAIDHTEVMVPLDKENAGKQIYESLEAGENCYTINYIFPDDTDLEKIASLPIPQGTKIATLSDKKITVDKNTFNLILQIRSLSKKQAASNSATPNICNIFNLKTHANFGEFGEISF